MSALLPIAEAALALSVAPSTLRRWCDKGGCPRARVGSRGRGHASLFDVEAIQAWRAAQTAEDACWLALAGEIPELVADAIDAAFRDATGPHKSALAGSFVAAWYVCTSALLDRMRAQHPRVPELQTVPDKITRLRAILGA